MTDDMTLLREFAGSNSEEAFATLVSRHVNLVYSVALRQVREPLMAEEITQAVFIILARKAKSLGPKTILPGWLCRTARNVSANALTMQRRRQRREQEAYMQSILNSGSDAPSQSIGEETWQQIAPLLDDALGQLGQKDHDALVLRFFENKSLGEVGQAIGASEDTARMRVNRALEKLRQLFSKHGVNSTAETIAGTISANSVQAAPVALAKTVTAVALAKGAAVSASTLTLIKGALKVMAWTKAKTAIVVGATTIALTIGTGYFGFFHQSPPRQPGKIKLPTGQAAPKIVLGTTFGIILASDGSLWSWGENDLGWPILGSSNTTHTPFLNRIGRENDWASIAAGSSHVLALKRDGTIWGWGSDVCDELGNHTNVLRVSRSANYSSTPIPSELGTDWKQIAAGYEDSFGIKEDGTMWAWGLNSFGQLGIGTVKSSPTPVQVDSATWEKVSAGGTHTAGIRSDGTLWVWGSGALDSNTIPSRTTFPRQETILVPKLLSPDTNWVDMTVNFDIIFAIKSDGTLWASGVNAVAFVGREYNQHSDALAKVGDDSDWQACSTGAFYLVLQKKDGSVWAMDATDHTKFSSQPKKFDLQKDIVAIGGGRGFGVALTRDGDVWTWGTVIGEDTNTIRGSVNNTQVVEPKRAVLDTPWQLSIVDSSDSTAK